MTAVDDRADGLLSEAFAERNRNAAMQRRRRRVLAWIVGLSAPTALSMVAVQQMYFAHDEFWSIVLVGSEFCVIAGALVVEYFGLGDSHRRWIRYRLQAELLRRDRFLLRAGVGPYLSAEDSSAVARNRIARICGHYGNPLEVLVAEGGHVWRDELDRQPVRRSRWSTIEELCTAIARYIDERLRDQIAYFAKGSVYRRADEWTELLAKAILLLTTVVVALKLATLIEELGQVWESRWLFGLLILGAFSAGLVALRGLFEPHRLVRSFLMSAQQLRELEGSWDALQQACGEDGSAPVDPALEVRFQRLLLETEAVLAEDFRRWWVVVDPEVPRGG